ncbi:hypothetical protein HH310_27940 [Actinoplanes sp. TBRC 11911]|uniref:hypothetical protein n=1 Tax=Actinoplanes sp. TBRC 11911 TaxID=2729386 RepID=UPI00145E4100|nr:hypothetical protein [Actinoplanes sp. TBRC 11911]NMO55003.1 hypothetical protein [Actinoplanes sp. TBRC 11911]
MTQTQLDRRREQSAAAKDAAEKARSAVTDLANRLQTNADLTEQQTLALRNAEAEAKRLKRSLKTQQRDRDRLAKAHQKAVGKASKASRRAESMDDKYSKSVLDDLVQREKEKDLRAAGVTSSPAPERAAATESPARQTAARTTTARAAKTASSSATTRSASTARSGRTASGRATKATKATKTTGTRTRRS